MKKYKYFFKSDIDKEAIGVIRAKNEKEAFIKAAKIKQLHIKHFVEIFFVEEI